MREKLNKKGFTLIELLGSTIIIGLLLLIVVPVVSGVLRSNRLSLYQRQIDIIVDAAKAWGSENFGELPAVNESSYVYLDQLKKGGYIDKNLKNPKTDEPFDELKTKVKIYNDNGILKYTVLIEE